MYRVLCAPFFAAKSSNGKAMPGWTKQTNGTLHHTTVQIYYSRAGCIVIGSRQHSAVRGKFTGCIAGWWLGQADQSEAGSVDGRSSSWSGGRSFPVSQCSLPPRSTPSSPPFAFLSSSPSASSSPRCICSAAAASLLLFPFRSVPRHPPHSLLFSPSRFCSIGLFLLSRSWSVCALSISTLRYPPRFSSSSLPLPHPPDSIFPFLRAPSLSHR